MSGKRAKRNKTRLANIVLLAIILAIVYFLYQYYSKNK